jgi:hypothetical protein
MFCDHPHCKQESVSCVSRLSSRACTGDGFDWHASGTAVHLRISPGQRHQDRNRPKGVAGVTASEDALFPFGDNIVTTMASPPAKHSSPVNFRLEDTNPFFPLSPRARMLRWVQDPVVDEIFGVPLHVQLTGIPLPVLVKSETEARVRGLFLTVDEAEAAYKSPAVVGAPPHDPAPKEALIPSSSRTAGAGDHSPLLGPVLRVSDALWKRRGAFSCMAPVQNRTIMNYNSHITDALRELVGLYAAKLDSRDTFRERSTKRASDFIARLPLRLCTPRQFECLIDDMPKEVQEASSLGAGSGSKTCEKVLQASAQLFTSCCQLLLCALRQVKCLSAFLFSCCRSS